MPQSSEHLDQPVLPYARKDFPVLRHDFTVAQALEAIRQQGLGEKVIYFYVVDVNDHLLGVLPTRRLLTSPLEAQLREIMINRVVAIPHTATILEACELFVMHRFLAFPVVDENRRILGVIDVSLFTEEVLDIGEQDNTDEVFEALGFRIDQVRSANPWNAFRLRYPWLLATVGSGIVCAFLASFFEKTLAGAIVIAFFITLVLALGEAVAIQSMALTVQALRSGRPTLKWFSRALWQESGTAILLGLGCGLLVAVVVGIWRGFGMAPVVIGGSIILSLGGACTFGLTVPAVLHWLRLDPKIAAGPVTLALTDIWTLFSYFGLAALLLGR